MGKILVIGVTCVDVVINVDRLPKTAEDVVVYGQRMTLGGCAFNAFAVMHALGEPTILFSPIGPARARTAISCASTWRRGGGLIAHR